MDKKGQIGEASSMMFWLMRIPWLGIAAVACLVLIAVFAKTSFTAEPAEREIFIQRLLYSPNGISFYDSLNGRMEPGTIDLRKVDSAVLEQLVAYDGDHLAAKIVLWDAETNKLLKETYYQQDVYKQWEPGKGRSGAGATDFLERSFYVLIKDQNKISKGQLNVTVLMLKR